MMSSVWRRFSRRKQLEAPGEGTTKLDKCLNTFDLTALGIGATLGELVVLCFLRRIQFDFMTSAVIFGEYGHHSPNFDTVSAF